MAELFHQITHYLVAQFCQIAHYLAEHLKCLKKCLSPMCWIGLRNEFWCYFKIAIRYLIAGIAFWYLLSVFAVCTCFEHLITCKKCSLLLLVFYIPYFFSFRQKEKLLYLYQNWLQRLLAKSFISCFFGFENSTLQTWQVELFNIVLRHNVKSKEKK